MDWSCILICFIRKIRFPKKSKSWLSLLFSSLFSYPLLLYGIGHEIVWNGPIFIKFGQKFYFCLIKKQIEKSQIVKLCTVKACNFGHFGRFSLKKLDIVWKSYYCFLKFCHLTKSLSNVNCEWKKHTTSFSYIWSQSGVRSYPPMSSNLGHPIKCL